MVEVIEYKMGTQKYINLCKKKVSLRKKLKQYFKEGKFKYMKN